LHQLRRRAIHREGPWQVALQHPQNWDAREYATSEDRCHLL